MEIMELAAALGDALKNDERVVRLDKAKKAYESDATIEKMLTEYGAQNQALQNEAAKSDRDTLLMDTIQQRINELYSAITENQLFVELNEAQMAVNEYMNQVNATITYHITGEKPEECTHNCATCHAGCSGK